MLLLSNIRDWLKTFNAAENYYIGRLDAKKEKSIGVYQLPPRPPTVSIGQKSSYEVKRISLLIHWNKNANDTEKAAYELYGKLSAVSSFDIEDTHIYFILLSHAEPVSISTDESGVYEYVIEFEIYYERKD